MAASVLTWSSPIASNSLAQKMTAVTLNGASSGYATTSSRSSGGSSNGHSDEELVLIKASTGEDNEWRLNEPSREGASPDATYPGICPHCKRIYNQPVTLQCGHSLCRLCSDLLLKEENSRHFTPACSSAGSGRNSSLSLTAAATEEKPIVLMASNAARRRLRPRMGISSFPRPHIYKADSLCSLSATKQTTPPLWLAPRCVVCSHPPNMILPVPNRDLEAFITSLLARRELRLEGTREEKTELRDCEVALVGSRGVGKSTLKQTQFSNDLLLEDLLSLHSATASRALALPTLPEDLNKSYSTRYMLHILDSSTSMEYKIRSARGFIVMYSIIDRESFLDAQSLFQLLISTRGPLVPIVLVGAKSDLAKKRVVHAYEGQRLARTYGCPFLECSSRRNDCVNEAFVELARIMEKRGSLSSTIDNGSC